MRGRKPPKGSSRVTITGMRRALAWLAGLVGIAALVRALRRRRTAGGPPAVAPEPLSPVAEPGTDDPAAELRRRLDEARTDGAGPAPDGQGEHGGSLEERRARVHARAQEAVELMREQESGP